MTFHEFAFTDPRHTWRPASISSPCFRLSHSRYPAHVRPLSIILSFTAFNVKRVVYDSKATKF